MRTLELVKDSKGWWLCSLENVKGKHTFGKTMDEAVGGFVREHLEELGLCFWVKHDPICVHHVPMPKEDS